ncbi:MAG: ABC transporter substrate-binding protein [Parvibaculum sp.]|uniref:MlaC/ttg2D family ABC transporter substrate-binding protein n=1 Tax=Parvibaculum sp. TaxID=2024848 RepID=UPI0025F91C3B|nr:ABC transporter substrate-binding protein [Parvibaculum sp.]MCE9650191.1 ABC transporter substrate-binding protein [Parvibaculum sp.]
MVRFLTTGRLSLFAALFGFLALVSAQTAVAGTDAETFTQKLVDQGVGILRNTGDPARRTKFREFITQYADARKTALFTLGNYRRGAADADVETFIKAFTDYATAVYESRLDQYKGQTLKVVGSTDNKPGDVTVNTIVVDPNARQPLRIAFRLLAGGGSFRFVDVQVEGIWLSIEQREQFSAFLSQNGGSIPRLTAHLSNQATQINAGMVSR